MTSLLPCVTNLNHGKQGQVLFCLLGPHSPSLRRRKVLFQTLGSLRSDSPCGWEVLPDAVLFFLCITAQRTCHDLRTDTAVLTKAQDAHRFPKMTSVGGFGTNGQGKMG